METLNDLRTILELGWPAIVMVMLFVLWREYMRLSSAYIADLRRMADVEAPQVIKVEAGKQHDQG